MPHTVGSELGDVLICGKFYNSRACAELHAARMSEGGGSLVRLPAAVLMIVADIYIYI